MECRLTNSDQPWQCQILLRREVDDDGRRIHGRDVLEEPFGPVLHDKAELEEMIRRAQLAILNPGVGKEFFETFQTSSLKRGEKPGISPKQLQFSSNVVCLDLLGPDLPDLSFIDLPGIISAVEEDEDERSIDAVKRMVEDHIQGDTLILLTINMRDDMSNQGAARLAKLADEAGERTIGVLTKADLIQDGEQDGWLSILEGSSHSLRHGYFITKHPSPTELEKKISHSQARELEAKFFQSTSPWNQQQVLQSRMGTPNLTKELSNLLGALINQALPKLRREAKDSLDIVREQLDALPPPPSENPAHELLRMVTTFTSEVRSFIQGAESHERLIQKCRLAYGAFKSHIRGTAPQFKPFESSREPGSKSYRSILSSEDEDDQADMQNRPMYLNDVRKHIESSLTRQLPFNVPFSAKVTLIEKVFEPWEDHCITCFGAVYDATADELYSTAERIFGSFQTPLLEQIRTVIDERLESAKSKTAERIQWMLEMEYPPFTNNDHYFSSYRDEYLAQFKEARNPTTEAKDPQLLQEALGLLVQLGYPASEDALARLHPPDEYEQELIVMAETSAYFRVCYKRIIDNIPRVIDHGFLRTIERELQSALISGLSLGTNQAHEHASAYLAEDKQVAATRVRLTQKNDRLQNVREELHQFQIPSATFPASLSARRPNGRKMTTLLSTADPVQSSSATSQFNPSSQTDKSSPAGPEAAVRFPVARRTEAKTESQNWPSSAVTTKPRKSWASLLATSAATASAPEDTVAEPAVADSSKNTSAPKAKKTATKSSVQAPTATPTLRASASEFTPTLFTGALSPRAPPFMWGSINNSPRRVASPTLTERAFGQYDSDEYAAGE
ncbi:dynamin domain-containing protein [Phanerochaete sordida]|uniref:Dynamin domain-containing protein n=1 Tax=Phanerochaete sordida TaxID=48140 RepID=A0A9P3GNM1_9APHY|nr:dynamin domain-containing protein [Phanerochaete sordida]